MNRREVAIDALEAKLGHRFLDRSLIDRALTHASASQGARKVPDNERLEFLGDRVLGLVMAHHLVVGDADATAGMLSKRLAGLVSRPACARAARDAGLGDALRLQGGETRRGGRDHDTILADACEAVIAALFLEIGLERTGAFKLCKISQAGNTQYMATYYECSGFNQDVRNRVMSTPNVTTNCSGTASIRHSVTASNNRIVPSNSCLPAIGDTRCHHSAATAAVVAM